MIASDKNKIESKIKQCKIAAMISILVTVALNTYFIYSSGAGFSAEALWTYADPVLMALFAFGTVVKKSRVCAILLFGFFLISKAVQIVEMPDTINAGSLIVGAYFAFAFWQGVSGTFGYHKYKKANTDVHSLPM